MKQINPDNLDHNHFKNHSKMRSKNRAQENKNKYRISNAHAMTTEELISAMRKKIKEICN